MRARGILAGLAATAAVAAIFLPGVRLDPGAVPRQAARDWSTASLLQDGWRTLRGEANDFAAAMDKLNLGHALVVASGQRRLAVSGIFRIGPYLAAPLVPAVGFFAIGMLLALFRQPGAAAVAFMCDFFALAGFVWIALAARSQRAALRSLGGAPAGGLELKAGLFLLPAALLAFSLLAARGDSAER